MELDGWGLRNPLRGFKTPARAAGFPTLGVGFQPMPNAARTATCDYRERGLSEPPISQERHPIELDGW